MATYWRGLPSASEGWDDGRVDPVDRPVLGAVPDFAAPDVAASDGAVHLLEKLLRVVAGVEDAVVLANQFLSGVLADGAEFVVHIGDRAPDVGHRHDGVLIEGELLVKHFRGDGFQLGCSLRHLSFQIFVEFSDLPFIFL